MLHSNGSYNRIRYTGTYQEGRFSDCHGFENESQDLHKRIKLNPIANKKK